eukprot:CAMPEP_0183417032 /NCGR_PEP_ID=MMETSP0370-20130417/24160_1 /TAXON_ID=268820 /ORGANISM="Peridinium aciculiferum, Strain PAER-2" /LENGTH=268 /DNA_ID=CAMNT_0025600583 /DNA_START=66 /DNA_END=870 /DNA_ORIENTATION=+
MATDEIRRVNKCGHEYYKILGVEKDAGDDVIKKAYRKLALRLHPDKCSEDGSEEAFKKVGEAFGVLSDDRKRQIYDQRGISGLRGGSGGGGGPDISPEDLFQVFFGGVGGGGGGMGPGVQTFRFSTGVGPGGGVFQFNTGGMGGGHPGMRQRRQPAQEDREEEEERQPEVPAWLTKFQTMAGSLGPLLPIVIVSLIGFGMLLMGKILQFMISRAFIIFPIMYMTEGKTKMLLLAAIVIGAMLASSEPAAPSLPPPPHSAASAAQSAAA